MRIEIATLFVDMCETVLDTSIIGRARRAGKLDIHCRDIRAYTLSKQGRVDDAPYGGGFGLVMQTEPIYRCYQSLSLIHIFSRSHSKGRYSRCRPA